jgi:Lysine methyltransferase
MGGREQQHAMRNLFRMDDDSSSSSSSSSSNEDDSDNDKGPTDATQLSSSSTPLSPSQISALTTITQTIHHVELEMCSIGGSIEHRLWPAATFLTSYILQPTVQQDKDNYSKNNDHRHHLTNDTTSKQIQENVQTMLENFRYMISENSAASTSNRQGLKILELGAGIGFTSLELAYHAFPTSNNNPTNDIEFLMTDLSSALPLLQRNRQRNFGLQNSSIQVQKLEWGNREDIEHAISWYNKGTKHQNCGDTESPLLILGTDCVYWESLYDILETTIASLLQNATPNSICLLANVRRWKRDTNFFQHKFGQFTSNKNGRLHCICIHEQVARNPFSSSCCNDDPGCSNSCAVGSSTEMFGHQKEQREVIRIYAIQWRVNIKK